MYKVLLSEQAEKSFAKLSAQNQKKIFNKLDILMQDPFLGKKLKGQLQGLYSFRAWPYRIIYEIVRNRLIVNVLEIARRQGVYK